MVGGEVRTVCGGYAVQVNVPESAKMEWASSIFRPVLCHLPFAKFKNSETGDSVGCIGTVRVLFMG